MSDDASRAFAVEGDINSLFKRYADVDVLQAIATPLTQSSAQWQNDVPYLTRAQNAQPAQQLQCHQPVEPTLRQ